MKPTDYSAWLQEAYRLTCVACRQQGLAEPTFRSWYRWYQQVPPWLDVTKMDGRE